MSGLIGHRYDIHQIQGDRRRIGLEDTRLFTLELEMISISHNVLEIVRVGFQ